MAGSHHTLQFCWGHRARDILDSLFPAYETIGSFVLSLHQVITNTRLIAPISAAAANQ